MERVNKTDFGSVITHTVAWQVVLMGIDHGFIKIVSEIANACKSSYVFIYDWHKPHPDFNPYGPGPKF